MLGGFTGAAIVGLGVMAATTFKKAWKGSMKEGGDTSGSFLEQAVYKVRQYGQWMSGIWDKVTEKMSSMFKKTGEGESVFAKLERAVYPIVYAVESVWVPAFLNAIDTVKGYFGSGADEMSQTWTDWIVDGIAKISRFIGNIELYFKIGVENVKLFATNGQILVGDFFNNFGKWFTWLGTNWYRVLLDMFDWAATIFINIGENLRTVFSKIWEWVKSGFTSELVLTKEDFKGLTDGYRSSLTDMPKIFTTELEKTTPAIEKLHRKMDIRNFKSEDAYKPMSPLQLKSTGFTAASTLNSFAAGRLGGPQGGPIDKIAKSTDETAKNTKAMANKQGPVWGP